MNELPVPPVGDELSFVATHLDDLCAEPSDEIAASTRWRGGQTAADAALGDWDVRGNAGRRNEVWPEDRRGASGLSPWIRHGLLPLRRVWDHVESGPARDVAKFRDELLWQEYARHLYARVGTRLQRPLRASAPTWNEQADPTGGELRCVDALMSELTSDGWLVNQTRMWFASHWSVRHGAHWRDGEDLFFRHLLDGSRAANRLGWQWTIGTGNGKPYGLSRWQVEKRAPGLCLSCAHRHRCPIQKWPAEVAPDWLPRSALLTSDPDLGATSGPLQAQRMDGSEPNAVWLTAESLGDADPALLAHPGLPALFVFDDALLARLRLSSKRLVFLTECLADLAERRDVHLFRGDPAAVLGEFRVAATFAPVPGWRRIAASTGAVVATHPWPWLRVPHAGPIGSFSAWRNSLR